MHNTLNIHQLLHWADKHHLGHDLKQAMFTVHFAHRRDLSPINILADIAAGIALDRVTAYAVLTDQRFAGDVRQKQHF